MTLINHRWEIAMHPERAARPGWDWWEQDRLAAMHAVIRPGDVVWEIGAEFGEQAALYASWGAELVLVEPSAEMWPWIADVWDRNGLDIPRTSICGFMADTMGSSPIMAHDGRWPDEANGPLTFAEFAVLGDSEHRATLDRMALAGGIPIPDVVSIDVEGAEYRVLLGAEWLITEARPIWFVSVHPEMLRDRYGDTPDDVLCHLEKHGYDLHRLAYDHEVHYICKPKP